MNKSKSSKYKRWFARISLVVLVLLFGGLVGLVTDVNEPTQYPVVSPDPWQTITDINADDSKKSEGLEPDNNQSSSIQPVEKNDQEYKPLELPDCVWIDIPFKYVFIKGTGPFHLGQTGILEKCTYSDGRKPTEEIAIPPKHQEVYINVTAQDDANISTICNSYPPEYYEECAEIVRYDY